MKLCNLIIVFIAILFSSCSNNRVPAPENKSKETPKALQTDNGGSESSFSLKKRGYDDIVEELYKELLEKNAALSSLEHNIEKIKDNSKDSAEAFNGFDAKNNAYYNATNTHLNAIKDSVLKNRIKFLLSKSLSGYKDKISAHNNLIATINTKDITLDDLHIVLKLTQTLTLIEQYQNSDLPSTKSLENISKAYDKLIATTDSLGKK